MSVGRGRINPEWQKLRDEGLSLREIAQQYDVSTATVQYHTSPHPVGLVISDEEKRKILDYYATGHTITQVAEYVQRARSSVYEIIRAGVRQGKVESNKLGDKDIPVPELAELRRHDDCPERELRGLTAEDYARLLEVNKEYDEEKAKQKR